MSSVKGFDEFLLEGSYDKLTGEIASAVMRKIKETNTGEEEFDGIKIIYGPGDDVPSFNEMIENEEYLDIDHFVDSVSGIDVTPGLITSSISRNRVVEFESIRATNGVNVKTLSLWELHISNHSLSISVVRFAILRLMLLSLVCTKSALTTSLVNKLRISDIVFFILIL